MSQFYRFQEVCTHLWIQAYNLMAEAQVIGGIDEKSSLKQLGKPTKEWNGASEI